MNAGLLAIRHGRHHHVARPEAFDRLLAHQIAAREAELVEARPLISTTPGTLDVERRLAPAADCVNVSDARCIEGVRLRDREAVAVVFRLTAASRNDRQAGRLQRIEQRPARCIDRSRILERALLLHLDLGETFRLAGEEFLNALRALPCITGGTGNSEV